MIPVFCKAKGGLYRVGELPPDVPCTIEWIGRCTGIDPSNVRQIERQSRRWFITLVRP